MILKHQLPIYNIMFKFGKHVQKYTMYFLRNNDYKYHPLFFQPLFFFYYKLYNSIHSFVKLQVIKERWGFGKFANAFTVNPFLLFGSWP